MVLVVASSAGSATTEGPPCAGVSNTRRDLLESVSVGASDRKSAPGSRLSGAMRTFARAPAGLSTNLEPGVDEMAPRGWTAAAPTGGEKYGRVTPRTGEGAAAGRTTGRGAPSAAAAPGGAVRS